MHILSTIRPTQNQLVVLATIIANKNHPAQAANDLSTNENIVAARNILMKLNVITYSDTSANLTSQGEQLAKDYDIMDEAGELTEKGQQLVNDTATSPLPSDQQINNPVDMGIEQPPVVPMEGFSPLFKHILYG